MKGIHILPLLICLAIKQSTSLAPSCEVSPLQEYSCVKAIDGRGFFHWRLDGNTLFAALQGETTGYVAIGFPSVAGSMSPADAVISVDTVPFRITGKSSSTVRPAPGTFPLSMVTSTFDSMLGLTTLAFVRELDGMVSAHNH